jgi:UV DNA damage endonuclease
MNNSEYYNKYIKYKTKYNNLKAGSKDINSDGYKFPKLRLGLCCSIMTLKYQNEIYSSRRSNLQTILTQGLGHGERVAKTNLTDLLRMILWSKHHGLRVMRISSELVPHGNNIKLEEAFGQKGKDYISLKFLQPYLECVGNLAKSEGMRLTFHPGQFVQMASPNETALRNSIRELTMNATFLNMMGMPKDSVIVFHIGGAYCDKPTTMKRFIKNFKQIPDEVRKRLVLENDEKCYDVADVLTICEAVNAPMVFDIFHYYCYKKYHPTETQESIDKLMPRILKTWKVRGIRPKVHLSEQMPHKQVGTHSIFIENIPKELLEIPSKYNTEIDIMIEAKGKEVTLGRLYKKYPALRPHPSKDLPLKLPKQALNDLKIPDELKEEVSCECEQ